MKKILIINGPNMNMLGKREIIYGSYSLKNMENILNKKFKKSNVKFTFFQSNSESKIISKIQKSNSFDFLVINPSGFSYNSYSILDAILSVNLKYIEIHVTNIFSRLGREKTIFSKNAIGVISGFGIYGYICAVDFIISL